MTTLRFDGSEAGAHVHVNVWAGADADHLARWQEKNRR